MKNLDNIFSLDEKVIVVTGASGLLGRMHVEAIAHQGGTPIIVDINKEGLKELKDSIYQKYAINCEIEFLDITKELDVQESANKIFMKYGKIDGLVNNAALNPKVSKKGNVNFNKIEDFDMKLWAQDLSVGVTGAFICIKHYGAKISQNVNGGSIVNISSDLGIISPDQRLYKQKDLDEESQPVKPISYSVVKSSLLGLSRYVATYWASKNVRSNCLLPGGVKTDQDDIFIKKIEKLIPMKRMAMENEYQAAIIFLLSDASSYMTGSNLIIDGGRTAW